MRLDDPAPESSSAPLPQQVRRALLQFDASLPIWVKLAVPILLLGILVGGLLTRAIYLAEADQIRSHFEEKALLITQGLQVVATRDENAELTRIAVDLQEHIDALTETEPAVLLVNVYAYVDETPTTVASSDHARVGVSGEATNDLAALHISEAILENTNVDGQEALEVIIPLRAGDGPIGVVGAYLSTAERDRALAALLRTSVLYVGGALLLVPVIILFTFRLLIFGRLRRLVAAANQVKGGNYSARVRGFTCSSARDEMVQLSARFNDMATSIEGLRHELEELATTDSLTGLCNRRYALEALDRDARLAKRRGRPLAVILTDVDSLKTLNDRYGHAIGDAVLKRSAAALRSALRVTDIAARIGGDEFLALLPDCDTESLRLVLARIQESIEPLGVPEMPGPVPLTMSAGAAVLGTGDDATTLMQRADLALYEAKRSGKNQARVAA